MILANLCPHRCIYMITDLCVVTQRDSLNFTLTLLTSLWLQKAVDINGDPCESTDLTLEI
jgi:hypothetical protein